MINKVQVNIFQKQKYSRKKIHGKYSFLDIDDCASSPCQNGGKCIDGVASFTCQCDPGWAGDVCDESKYNAKKVLDVNFVTKKSSLLDRWVKIYYSIFADVDECASHPCQNGATCIDEINDYSCDCAAGFTGEDCEKSEYRLKYNTSTSRFIEIG